MNTFVVEIPINDEKKMEEFQKVMDDYQDQMDKYVQEISETLGCSYWCAGDIVYLRSRSRWTQALEDELVRLDKLGKHPPVLAGWKGEPESEWKKITG
jgi:hypothetical protein